MKQTTEQNFDDNDDDFILIDPTTPQADTDDPAIRIIKNALSAFNFSESDIETLLAINQAA